jgi:hypothetical protein
MTKNFILVMCPSPGGNEEEKEIYLFFLPNLNDGILREERDLFFSSLELYLLSLLWNAPNFLLKWRRPWGFEKEEQLSL